LPARLVPAGRALGLGLGALAAEVGLSWLRRRIKTEGRFSTPAAREGVAAMPEHLFGQSLEELLIQEWGDHRSRVVAWRVIRSIVITESTDRRR
jgi:hypothetical protein